MSDPLDVREADHYSINQLLAMIVNELERIADALASLREDT